MKKYSGTGWASGIGLLGVSGMYGSISKELQRECIQYILEEYQFIDTASVYGEQGSVNQRLAQQAAHTSKRRPHLINKIGADLLETLEVEPLIDEFEAQQHLFRDYQPTLVMLHRPSQALIARDDAFFNHISKHGFDKGFGISTNSLDVLSSYHKHLKVDVVQVALNLLDYASNVNFLHFCAEEKIVVHARSVLSSGLLSGKYNIDKPFSFQDPMRARYTETEEKRNVLEKRLEKVSQIKHFYQQYVLEHNPLSLSQFVYALTTSSPLVDVVIKGGSTLQQLKENAQTNDIQDAKMTAEVFETHYLEWSAPY